MNDSNILPIPSGSFFGDFVLLPEGCQNTKNKLCTLKGILTYVSSRNGWVWQTDEWAGTTGGTSKSGTTDGASIPKWAQPIFGRQYDMSYLKAAILHDHYCYEENQVRTWQDTHLMFYDALIDLGVNKIKAKAMYFAVYWKGPRWEKTVSGDRCTDSFRGKICIKSSFRITEVRLEEAMYGSEGFDKKLLQVHNIVEKNPEISLEKLEAIAHELELNRSLQD